MIGWMSMDERLESELAKAWPKGQDKMAKIRESISKGIANSNWLNKDLQITNYNIRSMFFLKF